LVEEVIVNKSSRVEHFKRCTNANDGLERLIALLLSELRIAGEIAGPRPVAKLRSEALAALKKIFGEVNERVKVFRN